MVACCSIAYVALGSNLGDRAALLRGAVAALNQWPDTRLEMPADVASLYESTPCDVPDAQPDYLNSAVRLKTSLSAAELLCRLSRIEAAAGRTRRQPAESRTLDLDLLLFDERVMTSPRLCLPHPRLHERRFVLEPLAELAPDLVHPLLRRSVRDLLASARNRGGPADVRRVSGPEWADASKAISRHSPPAFPAVTS